MDEHHSWYNGSVWHSLTLPSICRSVTYILWSSDFASYLEEYLMEKRCTLDNGSVWLEDRPCKIYVGQWPIFHDPLILLHIIVRLELFLYIKKWHRRGVFEPLRALALVFQTIKFCFLYPSIYAEGFIVFSFPFVHPSRSWNLSKKFCEGFSSGLYITNYSSESIHIWTMGTLEDLLPCHLFWPLGSSPGVGLEVKI